MLKGTQAQGSKHKHNISIYPSPRWLGQQCQSGKTWQKERRSAQKAIKCPRKQEKAKIYYVNQIDML